MEKIGFIGLGIMGKPMSKNLLKAGYPLVVYDIVAAAVDGVVQAGAERGASPKDVAEKAAILNWMVKNDYDDVDQVGRIVSHYNMDPQEIIDAAAKNKQWDFGKSNW